VKCVRCGRDSKYKDRPGKVCPGCKTAFAFEPKDGDPVTDMLFLNAIKGVSGDGKVRWGVEHLFYEVNRRKRASSRMPLGCVLAALALAAFCTTLAVLVRVKGTAVLFIPGVVFTVVAVVGLVTRRRGTFVPIDQTTFNRLWNRWLQAFGKPSGLIERVPDPPVPTDLEADIGDYSFDRAVICDRARTVDLLVANNFHFENNCAVLSVDGYPKGPFPVVRRMLKRNPKLLVFVLHDATLPGCRLAHRLITDPDWFGGAGLRVIDLGLRPRHATTFNGLLLHGDGVKLDDEGGIAAGEAEWLRKYRLELAAARPEQVLKRLFAGLMAHANDDPRTGDTTGAVTTCGAFDAGGYSGDGGGDGGEGGADAFG
jgi:hypothetical protein